MAERQERSLIDVIAKRARYVSVRTRFSDDLLQATLEEMSFFQIVILGSDLDTRAFRFEWPFGYDNPKALLADNG